MYVASPETEFVFGVSTMSFFFSLVVLRASGCGDGNYPLRFFVLSFQNQFDENPSKSSESAHDEPARGIK